MAEHAPRTGRSARPGTGAEPGATPSGKQAEVLNRRSEAALAGPTRLLQRRSADEAAAAPAAPVREPGPQPVQGANRTGLPDRLKAGMEALSGLSMDDVRVHRNSAGPGRIGAAAYAQGDSIHLAPGEERHLPHEAWHVVQQRQGRVRPTRRLPGGVPVNDHRSLEQEADLMGRRALTAGAQPQGQSERPAAPPAPPGTAIVQPYWEHNPNGKPVWKNGRPPDGYEPTGAKKGGQDVFAPADQVRRMREEEALKREAEMETARKKVSDRALPPRRRRDFGFDERNRLDSLPHRVVREDHNLAAETGTTGRRKAHLVKEGLETAGSAPISATEQMDQDSVRKERGNRISSKAPAGSEDRSQSYGRQTVAIKARKLERARLRGKPDAQHVSVRTTREIGAELDQGPVSSDTGKSRSLLKGFATKDREFHHIVDFHSVEDRRNYIPNRFLVRPDKPEVHDSDSDSESEAELELAPPKVLRAKLPEPEPPKASGAAPKFWDEDYGMTRSGGRESNDMDDLTAE